MYAFLNKLITYFSKPSLATVLSTIHKPKFCVDCRHHREEVIKKYHPISTFWADGLSAKERDELSKSKETYHYCDRDKDKIYDYDKVTGTPFYFSPKRCNDERNRLSYDRYKDCSTGYCGHDGIFFEAIENKEIEI